MVAGQEEANILLSLLCTRLQLRLMSLSRERSRPRGPLSQVHSTLTRTLHTQSAPRVSPYIQLHPPRKRLCLTVCLPGAPAWSP